MFRAAAVKMAAAVILNEILLRFIAASCLFWYLIATI
jgi:hypothetical protein